MSYKGICSSRCFKAKSDKKRCRCKCKGNHHGEALQKKNIQSQIIADGAMSLDGGKTISNRADRKAPWEP